MATPFFLPPHVAVVGGKEVALGAIPYAQDGTHEIYFRNTSPLLPLTLNAPAMTGCSCIRVVTPQVVIPARGIGKVTVAIEASEVGERSEALQFTAFQGLRSQPAWVFLDYTITPIH